MASPKAIIIQATGLEGIGDPLLRDSIMDAGFTNLFDFRSDYSLDGTGQGAGKTYKNLVDGGANAIVLDAFASTSGTLGLRKTGAGKLQLPDNVKFATSATHFAVGVWFKQDLANLAISKSTGIVGFSTGNQTAAQWLFRADTNGSGVVTSGIFVADAAGATFAPLATALNDGNMHQYWFEFEVVNSGTQKRQRVYVDGAQAGDFTSSYDGSLIQPSGSPVPALGVSTASSITGQLSGYYGRFASKDFTVGGADRSVAEIVAAEWAKYGPAGSNRYGVTV